MLTPEQATKLEIARFLLNAGTPPEKVKDLAIPLSEWILKSDQSLPCGTGDKA